MNPEKIQHHIRHLQEYHDDLDKQIEKDYEQYRDDRLVAVMKKKKLALKDEIEHFKKQLEKAGNK